MLSFGLFSPLTAEASDSQSYDIFYKWLIDATKVGDLTLTTGNEFAYTHSYSLNLTGNTFKYYFDITSASGGVMVDSKKNFTFKMSSFNLQVWVDSCNQGYFLQSTTLNNINLYAVHSDGSQTVYSLDTKFNASNEVMTISTDTLYTEKDVIKFRVYMDTVPYNNVNATWGASGNVSSRIELKNAGIDIDIQSEEAGLLSGILGWVKKTAEDVSSGFANIGTWFAELPGKLWDVISNGLKSLFVPDEEFLTGYSDKWDELLSSRLGAVYQVVNVIDESWGNIQNADKVNTISMPSCTIPLPNGNSFSFGGYDVQIVPDRFDVLVTALKSIIGIVCTAMFINGLKNRYDEVMGTKG